MRMSSGKVVVVVELGGPNSTDSLAKHRKMLLVLNSIGTKSTERWTEYTYGYCKGNLKLNRT